MSIRIRRSLSLVSITAIGLLWLASPPAALAQSVDVCATARVQVKQEGGPTGRGFDGEVVIANGLTHFEAGDLEFQESFTFDGTSRDGSMTIQGSGSGQFHFRLKRKRNPKRLLNGRARIDFTATVDGASQENVAGHGRLRLRGKLSTNNDTCVRGKLKLRAE